MKTSKMACAMAGETLVFAVPNRIYWTRPDLGVEADFDPLVLSLNETARAHMLVETGGGLSLWVLDREGRRRRRPPAGL